VSDQGGRDEVQMTEEELRAVEAEIDRLDIDDVILQTVVSLINLGARKGAVGAPPEAGLTPDYAQLRTAIEGARALLAVVEPRHAAQLGPIRDAVSQLQIAYARGTGTAPEATPPGASGLGDPGAPPKPQGGQGGTGPAQPSRLWIPGQ
jgi:hypothetical protein